MSSTVRRPRRPKAVNSDRVLERGGQVGEAVLAATFARLYRDSLPALSIG